jgi:hypothetical protein
MTKLQVLLWDLNGTSESESTTNILTDEIMNRLIFQHILLAPRPDIICLTSFVSGKFHDKIPEVLNQCRYECAISRKINGDNGKLVLLAINRNGILRDYEIEYINSSFPADDNPKPDFCEIQLNNGTDGKLTIIGVRVHPNTKPSKDVEEGKQVKSLNKYLHQKHIKKDPNEKLICLGNFNWSYQHAYNKKLQEWEDIRKWFVYMDVLPGYIGGKQKDKTEYSFVSKIGRKTRSIQQDLIATTKNVQCEPDGYNWSFLSNYVAKENLEAEDYKPDLAGFPDHAILRIKVDLDPIPNSVSTVQ